MARKKSDNPLLGHWQCPGGGRAEVYQTKRLGHHFYTDCECCGWQSGSKPDRQNKIYHEADFLPGATVFKPSNVTDQPPKVGEVVEQKPLPSTEQEPLAAVIEGEVTEKVTEKTADFDPTKEPETTEPETEQEQQEPAPRRGMAALIAGGVMLTAAALGFISHGR